MLPNPKKVEIIIFKPEFNVSSNKSSKQQVQIVNCLVTGVNQVLIVTPHDLHLRELLYILRRISYNGKTNIRSKGKDTALALSSTNSKYSLNPPTFCLNLPLSRAISSYSSLAAVS